MSPAKIRRWCLKEARMLFKETDPTAEQVLEVAKKFLAFVDVGGTPLESID